MYHEEKVIDGILCHRTTPDGYWIPYTLEAMTIALRAERTQNEKHRTLWLAADAKLLEIRAVLSRGD
ncbi:MAG: hypothetical protein ACYTBJ_25835 [Planctomycetota bacterium]|jgi:hypothetical protein